MTNHMPAIGNINFGPLANFMVGHDKLLDRLFNVTEEAERSTKYPPYNIVKQGDNNYAIEIAVAGFSREQLTIEQDGDKITVKGDVWKFDGEEIEYVYRGIAKRPFTRVFTVADHVEVTGAAIVNGMLVITLEHHVPEELMPKQIPIL